MPFPLSPMFPAVTRTITRTHCVHACHHNNATPLCCCAGACPGSPAVAENFTEFMPFEHSVLDCALNEVTARLSREVRELTGRAKPIVDKMTSDVARETLLAVRDLKNEQQELHNRVDVVCEQLEALSGACPLSPQAHPALHACRYVVLCALTRGRGRCACMHRCPMPATPM